MGENEPIKYSDLLLPDDSFQQLITLLEKVGSEYSNLLSTIQTASARIKDNLSAINSTTEQGRNSIANYSKEIEVLAAKEKELATQYQAIDKAAVSAHRTRSKAKNLAKQEVALAQAEEGSYTALSAQYNINKERLNNMSEATRKNTEEGQKLEAETLAIYQKMKQLQEVTGKHVLSVGDYGQATITLAADIRNATQALTQMRVQGKQNSQQYIDLTNKLNTLKREYNRAKVEINAMAATSGQLNQALAGLSAIQGTMAGTALLFSDNESKLGQSLIFVSTGVAVINAAMQVWNNLLKSVTVTQAIYNAQTAWAIRARAINIALIKGETKATWSLVAAQRVLNAVAKANPYVLMGAAIAATAGGLIALASNAGKTSRKLKELNAEIKKFHDYQKGISEIESKPYELLISRLERYKQELETLGNSEYSLLGTEKSILDARRKIVYNNLSIYDEEVKNLEKNLEKQETYLGALRRVQRELWEQFGSKGKKPGRTWEYVFDEDFAIPELRGMKVKAKELEEIIQGYYDNITTEVEVGIKAKTDEAQFQTDWNNYKTKVIKVTEDIQHDVNTRENQLIQQRFTAQSKAAEEEYRHEKQVLLNRLKDETGLTEEQKNLLNTKLLALGKKYNQEIAKINYEQQKAEREAVRETEDLRRKSIKDSYEQSRKDIQTSYQRQREDLQGEIDNNKTLTDKELSELREQLKATYLAETKELSDLQHEQYLKELALVRENQDLLLDAKTESFEKELEELRINNERAKEDIQDRLDFEILTAKERATLEAQLLSLDKRYAKERRDILRELNQALLTNDKSMWETRKDSVNEYTFEYIKSVQKIIDANEELEILQFQLEAERLGLSLEDTLKGENAIRDKYRKLRFKSDQEYYTKNFDLQQELEESTFHLVKHTEKEETDFERKQRIERWQYLLDIDKKYGGLLTETQRKILENRIKAAQNEKTVVENIIDTLKPWYDFTNEWAEQMINIYQMVLDARMELADAMVSAAEREVEATQSALDRELEARANGYANNATLARKELEESKKREREALEYQRSVEREQENINTLQQISSLVTATAQFWETSSALGPIAGPIAAGIATGTMWTAFLAAKVRASQLKKEAAEYGEGTVELLKGGSHSSGRDIPLGYTSDGRERRAEGGEFFIIINKKNSRKYGGLIPEVANALNKGDFEDKFGRKTFFGVNTIENEPGIGVSNNIYKALREFTLGYGTTHTTDVSRLESDLSAVRKLLSTSEYTEPDGTRVIKTGNVKRRILNG